MTENACVDLLKSRQENTDILQRHHGVVFFKTPAHTKCRFTVCLIHLESKFALKR